MNDKKHWEQIRIHTALKSLSIKAADDKTDAHATNKPTWCECWYGYLYSYCLKGRYLFSSDHISRKAKSIVCIISEIAFITFISFF